MTYEEISEMMQEIGLPFAYHHFAEGESPDPPFTLFLSPGENTFGADNLMYASFKRLHIELYTDEKSPDAEELPGAGAAVPPAAAAPAAPAAAPRREPARMNWFAWKGCSRATKSIT